MARAAAPESHVQKPGGCIDQHYSDLFLSELAPVFVGLQQPGAAGKVRLSVVIGVARREAIDIHSATKVQRHSNAHEPCHCTTTCGVSH